MLNIALKTGDRIQIGDDVVIKLQSDTRAQLAIDAPREVCIKRLDGEKKSSGNMKGLSAVTSGKKIIYVSDNSDQIK